MKKGIKYLIVVTILIVTFGAINILVDFCVDYKQNMRLLNGMNKYLQMSEQMSIDFAQFAND